MLICYFFLSAFQCLTCEKYFKTVKILKRHIERQHIEKTVSDDRLFECYQCRIELKSLGETRIHLSKQHTVTRQIKCSICKDRLTVKEFNQHLCFDLQTIQCEYCLLSFKTTTCLLTHLENSHDEKQLYRCEHCPRFFAMSILKEYHTRQHIVVAKTFACEKCPKKYISKTTLLNHMKIHVMELCKW